MKKFQFNEFKSAWITKDQLSPAAYAWLERNYPGDGNVLRINIDAAAYYLEEVLRINIDAAVYCLEEEVDLKENDLNDQMVGELKSLFDQATQYGYGDIEIFK